MTTRGILLAKHHVKEERTYFDSLLSGQWKTEQSETTISNQERMVSSFDIPDRDGDMFFHILFYLRFGDLPRAQKSSSPYDTFLSFAERSKLMGEADFYGLVGLEKICRVSLDLLRGFRDVGDLNLSLYSDFFVSVKAGDYTYSYHMYYSYKGTKLRVFYRYNCGSDECVLHGTESISKEEFVPIFRELQNIITEMCNSKGEDDYGPTVSEILTCVPTTVIPDKARLWWAIIISRMLEEYFFNQDWDFFFGNDDKDVLGFIHLALEPP